MQTFADEKDIAWARTFIHRETERELDAWIGFNTPSTSGRRAGAAVAGQWNPNQNCAIWINREPIAPPHWQHPGRNNSELPFTDEIYSNRQPTKIQLHEGWNEVLIRTAPSYKWSFTFTPIRWDGTLAREVEGLRWSSEIPESMD